MHGLHSKKITKLFDKIAYKFGDDEDPAFAGKEDSFYDLFDFFYDTSSWLHPESIEAAFSLGQKNPTAKRYSVWWGDAVCWFLGEEDKIVEKLQNFLKDLEKEK
jgi:hypothetical protein